MKILVVKRDKVGDLLLATPMLQVLRAALPQARIDVLATTYNAWVLDGFEAVDRVWSYSRARIGRRVFPVAAADQLLLWLRLRAACYDVAIAANGEASQRATRRALYAGARRTIAYADRTMRGLTDPLAAPGLEHERVSLLRLLAPLGVDLPEHLPDPVFRPSQAICADARRWLDGRGLTPGRFAVIGLGARRARKQPEARQVLRWSAALRERGLDTVFMWTPGASDDALYPGDDEAAGAILAAGATGLHPYRGPLPLGAAIVWHARVSLFPDSGLMHIAAASAGGVLGFFAEPEVSPPAEKWGPLGPRAECLVAPRRVSDIPDASVLARIDALLARPFSLAESVCTGSD